VGFNQCNWEAILQMESLQDTRASEEWNTNMQFQNVCDDGRSFENNPLI
jgi:hypothetical protein